MFVGTCVKIRSVIHMKFYDDVNKTLCLRLGDIICSTVCKI